MSILNTRLIEGKSVVVFGELLFDIIKKQDSGLAADEVPGGAPANFAYRFLTRQDSTDHLKVRLVSCVGQDTRGNTICDLLSSRGLDISLIQRSPDFKTGTVDVIHRGDQEATYTINKNAAYDHIKLTTLQLDTAKDAKIFYFGSLIQRVPEGSLRTLQAMLEVAPHEAVKFVDINLRNECYCQASIRWSVNNATVLKLNDKEWIEVANASEINASTAREFAEKLAVRDGKIVIVTLAEKGAFVVSSEPAGIKFYYEPGYNLGKNLLEKFDTIGCGDSFGAEFARLLLAGKSIQECLRSANEIGAAVALTKGGQSLINEQDLAIVRNQPRNIEREYMLELRR